MAGHGCRPLGPLEVGEGRRGEGLEPACGVRHLGPGPQSARRGGVGAQHPAVGVPDHHVEGQRRTARGQQFVVAPAAHDDLEQPLVEVHEGLDSGQLGCVLVALGAQPGQRLGHLGEPLGIVEGDGRLLADRVDQVDLLGPEPATGSLGHQEGAEDASVHGERDAHDRPDALGSDDRVDVGQVDDTGFGQVVDHRHRRVARRDRPQDARPQRHADRAVLRGDHAVGLADVRLPGGVVVERQVGHVGSHELARPGHDGLQDGLDVPDPRQVGGGVVQDAEEVLPASGALDLLVDRQQALHQRGRQGRRGEVGGEGGGGDPLVEVGEEPQPRVVVHGHPLCAE